MYKIIQVTTIQKWWQDAKKIPPLGNSKVYFRVYINYVIVSKECCKVQDNIACEAIDPRV
jgi:hypothetical protein